jgi:hypothetical protein
MFSKDFPECHVLRRYCNHDHPAKPKLSPYSLCIRFWIVVQYGEIGVCYRKRPFMHDDLEKMVEIKATRW